MHDIPLITTLALGFTGALFFGIIAKRCGLPTMVGYLLAGVAAGPHTPGLAGDTTLAPQLAEIGVILLMFGVGLHFHLKDLLAVRKIAITGAIGQSTIATLFALGVSELAGWTWQNGLVLGIAVSVASTVVLLRVLIDHNRLETPEGHVAVGWLIVEDLITVLVLVIMPALAGTDDGGRILQTAGLAIFKLVVLIALIAFVGSRVVPWVLLRVARLRSRELFTLAVLVMSIAVATASYYAFGASMALGAFLAGMLVGQSKFSHQAGAEILPLRDAFAVMFFVSVGMLFDFHEVFSAPYLTLGILGVILLVKPLIAFLIVTVLHYPLRTALTVAVGLAQIGEFSFILAETAQTYHLLPTQGHDILVACAIVSITLNPLLFKALPKIERTILGRPAVAAWFTRHSEKRRATLNADFSFAKKEGTHAIVVGYGPVGLTMTNLLREFGVDPLIIEMSVDTVAELRSHQRPALYGDASHEDILLAAGIKDANYLIITLPDPTVRIAIITAARELNPQITILTRARYLRENPHLREAGVTNICFDEVETAAGLAEALLLRMGIERKRIDEEIPRIRAEWALITELQSEINKEDPSP